MIIFRVKCLLRCRSGFDELVAAATTRDVIKINNESYGFAAKQDQVQRMCGVNG